MSPRRNAVATLLGDEIVAFLFRADRFESPVFHGGRVDAAKEPFRGEIRTASTPQGFVWN